MMRIKRGIGFLMTLSLLTAGCAKSQFNLSNHERKTLASVQETRLLNARESPTPSIRPKTRYAAARLFETQGQLGRALDQYRKAVAADPEFAAAHHRIALLLSKMSRHDAAIGAFQRAVAIEPNNARFRNNFGFELMFGQRWSEAEAQLKRAIELQPNFARAYVNLAMALSKQGRFDEALGAFQRVLPEPDAYYNLGLLYRGQGDYGQASRTFQHVLSLNPNFTAARKQLAELARLVGRDALGGRAQRLADATDASTVPPAVASDALPAAPRRLNHGSTTAVNARAKTFWKPARQPKPLRSQPPAVRDFTSTRRLVSESVDVSEPVEVSWIDEFPAPVPLGDIASTVAMIDDEADCVRNEIENAEPGSFAENSVVSAALRGAASPYRPPLSHQLSGAPLFSEGSIGQSSSTHEDVEPNCPEDSVVTMRQPAALLASPSHRMASAIAAVPRTDDLRTPYVDLPLAGSAVGTAFARATWADDAPSSNPKFSHHNDLVALHGALRRVRLEIEAIKNEDRQRTSAYAAARTESYRARLASASVESSPARKYGVAPTTLRDFAMFQLEGTDPETLASIVAPRETRTRRPTRRAAKAVLVRDKPPATQKPRRVRPRTEAWPADWNPSVAPFRPNDRWFTPPVHVIRMEDERAESPSIAVRDPWLRDFDELDGLISIIRNEMLCQGTNKIKLAVPGWTHVDEPDYSTLEPEPIMCVLPDSAYTTVCDPNAPDMDLDAIILGNAR